MRKRIALMAAVLLSIGTCAADGLYHEKYRPQYHFSPDSGWIGDPSGLVYFQGQYHMYWWGKAVSDDLVHYRQLTPGSARRANMQGASDNIAYFTGSVAIDRENTAGFGRNAFIAAYTSYEKDTKKQAQSISYSLDGTTFHWWDRNPVIDQWSTEFRDPTVFWHEPSRRWVMVVAKALERKVLFYTSENLKDWQYASQFGPWGDQEKSWECPDLFQLPVDGHPEETRWVLLVSINWAQEQYFIGDFDGREFRLMDGHPETPLLVDKGLDYYASRTFRNYDDTPLPTVSLGWVATWDYAPQQPTSWGKGFWSIPRTLALKRYPEGIRLTQQPVSQLETLRQQETAFAATLPVGIRTLQRFRPEKNVYEMDVTFSTDRPNTFGLNLCVGEGRKVVVSYDTESCRLLIDRTHCAAEDIPRFSRMAHARVEPVDGALRLHVFVDQSSIEIFCNDGRDVFTLQTFPSERQTGIETFALRPGTKMSFRGWPLGSVW